MTPFDDDPLLSLEEVASYLLFSHSKIYAMLRNGELPGQKIGKQWRFRRSAVRAWLNAQPTAAAAGLVARSLNAPVFTPAAAPLKLTSAQRALLDGVWIDRLDKFVAIAAKPAGKASLAKLLGLTPEQIDALARSMQSDEDFRPEAMSQS